MSVSYPLAVLDCETTGFHRGARIVEIAVVSLDSQSWEIIDEYDTLINPKPDDMNATHVHGITKKMVESAPTFSEIAAELVERLDGSVLIAHNFPFDARMLRQEFDRLGINYDLGTGLCTMWGCGGEKLAIACKRHGIKLNDHHAALADTRAAAALAKRVLKNSPGRPRPAKFVDIPRSSSSRALPRGQL